jgi:hypothetical protein
MEHALKFKCPTSLVRGWTVPPNSPVNTCGWYTVGITQYSISYLSIYLIYLSIHLPTCLPPIYPSVHHIKTHTHTHKHMHTLSHMHVCAHMFFKDVYCPLTLSHIYLVHKFVRNDLHAFQCHQTVQLLYNTDIHSSITIKDKDTVVFRRQCL